MTYARSRLLLGASNVGFWVIFSSLFLYFELPQELLGADSFQSFDQQLIGLSYCLLVYLALSIPFDFVGGYYLPTKYERTKTHLFQYIKSWLYSTLIHSSIIFLFAAVVLLTSNIYGSTAAFLILVCNVLLLTFGQSVFSLLISGKVIPDDIAKTVTEDSKIILMDRRELSRTLGLVARGKALAILWTIIGALFSLLPEASSLINLSGIVTFSLYFTLWSFLGLLTLPSANRRAVYWLDKEFLQKHGDVDKVSEAILNYDKTLEDESERSPAVETIFHPIPAAAHRVQRIKSEKIDKSELEWWAGWQMARFALYFSWAGFGLLSRAVHCNVGKPESWVFLPSD